MPKNKKLPKIVVIGGGTGSFVLLNALKESTPELTAIVNMSDDGGSTGVLRDELGVLPPGDIRQCLVALSDNTEVRDLFSYRFGHSRFKGHSLGNIILSGLELQYGSFDQAVKVAGRILRITGKVVPITLDNHTLEMRDGKTTIRGENNINFHKINSSEVKLNLKPSAKINQEARDAIISADLIVIAPGNLYGSLLPIFTVNGTVEAIASSKGKVVLITNLVTKPGQTDGWHVIDYVRRFEKYLGERQIDFVLYNNEPPSDYLLEKYAEEGEFPVSASPDEFKETRVTVIGASLVAKEVVSQDPHDKLLRRTLIRHDGKAVDQQLMKILNY